MLEFFLIHLSSIVPKNSLKPLTQRHSSDHGRLASFVLSSSEYLTSAKVEVRTTIMRSPLICLLSSCSESSIFIAGLLTYTWLRQEHPVAMLTSVAAVVGLLFIR